MKAGPLFVRQRGVALILVLGAVALVATLVVVFLSLVRSEQRSGAAFADTVEAQNLSEIPINLAISQIRLATEQNGIDKTWASQPGLLRVFGTTPDTAVQDVRSTTLALYKLYSDDEMTVGSKQSTPGMGIDTVQTHLQSDLADLAAWNTLPGLFVDLNEPAAVIHPGTDKVTAQFPICDPRARFAAEGGAPVDGFDAAVNVLPGTQAPANAADLATRLPMPVRWLYLLEDGSLVAPTGGSAADGLEFPAGQAPSAANPIVGRIAFWTDDESCKINVNTATEGQPWDMPRAYSATEIAFARRLPAQNEFSRYPGHPAQTCLSPVFQAFGADWKVSPADPDAVRAAVGERYMNLNPRIPWGGSRSASRNLDAGEVAIPIVDAQGRSKDGRLYATLDELIFTRDRGAQTPALDPAQINLSRFFLTTHSRAPELNLFNRPRVSLWPQSLNEAQRNAKDKLIAFQSTLGSGGGAQKFYFQRKSNFGPLPNTPPHPASASSSQYPDWDLSITGGDEADANGAPARNRELYTGYLQPATAQPIPGFGGNFEQKWGAARRDQVLTQMFDFMRFALNSMPCGLAPNPELSYLPTKYGNTLRTGEASAVPTIASNNTRGFGRWPTITEAVLVFTASEVGDPGTLDAEGFIAGTSRMRAYLILEPFTPSAGQPCPAADIRYRVTFSGAGFSSLGFPVDTPLTKRCNTGNLWLEYAHSTPWSGIGQQIKKAFLSTTNNTASARLLGRTDESNDYVFYSDPVAIPAGDTRFAFDGGSLKIEILTGTQPSAANADVIQTLHLNFPAVSGGLQVPKITPADHGKGFLNLSTRFAPTPASLPTSLIIKGDITRSVEVKPDHPAFRGDLRLLFSQKEVPESWFQPSYDLSDSDTRNIHFLRTGSYTYQGQYGPADPGGPVGQAPHSTARPDTHQTGGSLVAGLTYFRDTQPSVPRGLNGAFNADGRPGDFDTAMGRIEDGPYINLPDIGSLDTTADPTMGYFSKGTWYYQGGPTFSPSRQAASAVVFGSLPTGIPGDAAATAGATLRPWQTLLFCPNPASRSTPALAEPQAADHEGFTTPRDHLLLDLFWMPVIDPYAISDGLATAGKINMNYRMQPFHHIERSTGIHAVLKSSLLMATSPNSVGGVTAAGYDNGGNGQNYKESRPDNAPKHLHELRYLVNAQETLKGFENRFNTGDVFRSASEICELFLVPKRFPGAPYNTDAAPPGSYNTMVSWWNGNLGSADAFEPTGDNMREAPYNQIYPRLTTKSNTYTVHYRVQRLQKARATDPARWIEGRDSILAEHRGSAVLERYIDPHAAELNAQPQTGSGFADPLTTLDHHCRIRIVERKSFSP